MRTARIRVRFKVKGRTFDEQATNWRKLLALDPHLVSRPEWADWALANVTEIKKLAAERWRLRSLS